MKFIFKEKTDRTSGTDCNLTDYRCYKLSIREYLFYFLIWFLSVVAVSIAFYNSLIPLVVFMPTLIPYYKYLSGYLCERRCNMLCHQFKDAIMAISASLEAGYSMENAIWDAYLQICTMYSPGCYMACELYAIYNQLKISISIESAFEFFSQRTAIDDIHMFCDILKIAKRTGGNISEIIGNTAETIGEKFDIKREIKSNIDGKRFEQMIMLIMPFFIILYLRFSSPGFFSPLYYNLTGIAISTCCLLLYAFAIFLTIKITDINP